MGQRWSIGTSDPEPLATKGLATMCQTFHLVLCSSLLFFLTHQGEVCAVPLGKGLHLSPVQEHLWIELASGGLS